MKSRSCRKRAMWRARARPPGAPPDTPRPPQRGGTSWGEAARFGGGRKAPPEHHRPDQAVEILVEEVGAFGRGRKAQAVRRTGSLRDAPVGVRRQVVDLVKDQEAERTKVSRAAPGGVVRDNGGLTQVPRS